jgi:hypothetical protein
MPPSARRRGILRDRARDRAEVEQQGRTRSEPDETTAGRLAETHIARSKRKARHMPGPGNMAGGRGMLSVYSHAVRSSEAIAAVLEDYTLITVD